MDRAALLRAIAGEEDAPAPMPLPEATADTLLEAYNSYRHRHGFLPGDLVIHKHGLDPRKDEHRSQPMVFLAPSAPGIDGWPPVMDRPEHSKLRCDCVLMVRISGEIVFAYADSATLEPWTPPAPDAAP